MAQDLDQKDLERLMDATIRLADVAERLEKNHNVNTINVGNERTEKFVWVACTLCAVMFVMFLFIVPALFRTQDYLNSIFLQVPELQKIMKEK